MTVKRLSDLCRLTSVTISIPEKEITEVYCCDLLSTVIGKAPTGCAWITVIANINSVAVASLADIGVIIFADGIKPDNTVILKAKENNINILLSNDSIFNTALSVYDTLKTIN